MCHHWRRGQAAPAAPEDSQPDGHDEDGCEHVRHLGHHEDDEAEEGQAEIVRCRIPEGRELRGLACFLAVSLEFQVRHDDRDPVDDGSADCKGQEVHEDFSREEIGHGDDEQGQARAETERVDRYAPRRQLLEPLRGVAFFCQAEGDAGIAVNGRVIDGNGCRQDDEVEEIGRCREADVSENLDEGTVLCTNLVPWPQGHDDDHGADVEDEDAPDDLVDGLGQGPFGIFCFSRRDANQFDAAKGKDDRHHGQAEAPDPVWQDAAVIPEIAEILREGPAVLADEPGAEGDHAQDGRHFDEGHPEFRFTVGPDVDQIETSDGHETDQGRHPLRQVGQPVMDVDADSCQFGHADDDIREPVIPAQHETRERAPVLVGVITEGPGHRFFDGHFPQHAHDEENDDAADEIGCDDRRPAQGNGRRRPIKQPRTDSAAQGNHLEMTILQAALHL